MKGKTLTAILLLALFLPLLPPGARAGRDERRTEKVPKTYVIVRHDTLWDISARFLKDPFKWPSIWKLNPYIKNPDLIYPGDILKIPPYVPEEKKGLPSLPVVRLEDGGKVVVLQPEVKEEEKPAPPRPQFTSGVMKKTGFIETDGIEEAGSIIKGRENVIYLTTGGRVYLSFRDNSEVRPGERYIIFRKRREVVHPVTRKRMGYMVDVLGSLVITENVGVVEGRIEKVYKEIESGALLMAYREPVTAVPITEAPIGVDGYIIASLEGASNLSKGDIVYIDRGRDDGLGRGNVMYIYRLGKKAKDPLTGKEMELPPTMIGTLVVIEPGNETSSAIITKSLKAIETGDFVTTTVEE